MFFRYAAFLVLEFSFVLGVIATVETHRGVQLQNSPAAAIVKNVG